MFVSVRVVRQTTNVRNHAYPPNSEDDYEHLVYNCSKVTTTLPIAVRVPSVTIALLSTMGRSND